MSIHEILYKYWGYHQFRPLQEDIIQSILQKKDTLALLPTGGGKSICYQVPTMAMEGLCIVVSPLIALIKDQVESLQKKELPALMLYSGMPFKQVDNVLKNAVSGKYKFLYVSPERLETKLFLEYLPAMQVCLIAVDEAHCISQWGYDFRPPYLRIAALRTALPNVPIIAVTASATQLVQKDICEKLLFHQPALFQQSFSRPNLSYSSFLVESKINKAVDILNAVKGSAIVYCKSRRRTKEISELLQYYNINATYYNAGLSNEERSQKQAQWVANENRVMVCTNAFGMGIDKPDVRAVIHYDVPDCVENYYQEAGRAGRDGKKAYAVLLYQERDIEQLNAQIDIRFPPLEKVADVYTNIGNYLQLATGDGEGSYYEFDNVEFCKRFNYDILTVHYSLQLLAQENLLLFNEAVFLPTTVNVVATRETLAALEIEFPYLSEVVKILLRTYSGIMGSTVIINEKNIAYLLKQDVATIQLRLQQLQKKGIIDYEKSTEAAQLYYPVARIHSNHLQLNNHNYTYRKEIYYKRVQAMVTYIKTTTCRSNYISNYFSVPESNNCGVCDGCLKAAKTSASLQKKELLVQHILTLMQVKKTLLLVDLQQQLHSNYKVEWVKDALHTLLAEEKIVFKEEQVVLVSR